MERPGNALRLLWHPAFGQLQPRRRRGAGQAIGGRPGDRIGTAYALPDAIGWYPALIVDPAGEPVHGLGFAATAGFSADDLAALGAYEDCREAIALRNTCAGRSR